LIFSEAISSALAVSIVTAGSTTSQSSVTYKFDLTVATNVNSSSCFWVYPPTACLSLILGTPVTNSSNCSLSSSLTPGSVASF